MNFALGYLVGRLAYRIYDFLHHWYVHGSRAIFAFGSDMFDGVERTFAVGTTARYFLHPLYKDYTIVGRIEGVVYRAFRILTGLALHLVFGAVFLVVYIAWIFLLPALAFYALGLYS